MTQRKRSSPEDDLSNSSDSELESPQLENDDDLKTHYYITPKTNSTDSSFENVYCRVTSQPKQPQKNTTPFLSLLDGNESSENVLRRFELYNQVWANQSDKIQSILNNANDELFKDLIQFVNLENLQQLSVGYVQLTTNTANNLRILQEFYQYIQRKSDYDYKLITLNSKHFTYNIKATLREVVKQFHDTCQIVEEMHRLNYDLDAIDDWFDEERLYNSRLVLVLEDTNLINNQLLNQLLKILLSYVGKWPLKIVMGLSCETVSSWINGNLTNELRIGIEGHKFKSNDNKSLGYIILNNLFLTPELTPENPLLINSTLSTIILNRFENSNNSIDALIAEIKLCYMIYFYRLPLSILIAEENPQPQELYADGLRKLSSFKKYIELKLHQGDRSVKDLLNNDKSVIKLFNESRSNFRKFKLAVMNAINIIYQLHPNKLKQKFELYKLLINHKLLNSKYLYELVKNLSKLSDSVLGKVLIGLTDNCTEILDGISDNHLIQLIKGLGELSDLRGVSDKLQNYFDNSILTTPLEYMVFHEVFSMDGGLIQEKFTKPPLFEENYENLMINLLRPNLRATIERGLDNYETYLANPLIENSVEQPLMPPTLTHLFKLYKEAPTTINLYDFYQAFKSTLDEKELSLQLSTNEDWEKLTYAWFVQNCHELMLMGILQQKPKGDFLEKAIWKGI